MDPRHEFLEQQTRRYFFGRMATGIGSAALASLLNPHLFGGGSAVAASASAGEPATDTNVGILPQPHFAPRAKRVISLFMSEGPSQFETFDYKPKLNDLFDTDLPESVRGGQRITTMTSGQKRLPIAPSAFKFNQCGEQGTWISELLPHLGGVVDDMTIIRSVHTEAINHDPAITFAVTGSQLPGRPSLGSWLSYGLGSENKNLPAFVVMHSSWTGRKEAQALFARLWGSGFLPSKHQGVLLRSKGERVLYLANPPGVSEAMRRNMLDGLAELNARHYEESGDPEIQARIAQYEMAYRMQTAVPELTDLSDETAETLELYGPEVNTPGTFAASCLLARRLIEREVRFVQIFIRGWDQHFNLPTDLKNQCHDIDQGSAALITDLKRRGLLDDTLVTWGGEFGRTVYCQGTLTRENYGRDHHPRCFPMWMAGGGVKGGMVYGETDEFSYNIVANPVHVHDVNATILGCLGIDHTRLTYRFQGRDFRLTDIHGKVVSDILA